MLDTPSKPLRVLFVEDREDDVLLSLHALKRSGFAVVYDRVETATAMREALAQQQWDVVIADYSLPRFSGPDALQVLRESGLDRPFIIVSGTVGEENAVAVMKAGAHDYLMKDNLKRLGPVIEREVRDAAIRAAQRQAMASLHLHDRAIAASENGIMIVDTRQPAHPIIYVNPAFEKLTGYGAAEVVNQNARLLQGPQTDPEVTAKIRRAIAATEPLQVEILNYRKDGSTFWNALSLAPVYDEAGQLTHYIGIQQDLTARKQVEDELRQSQARFASIFRATSAAMCITTVATGRILDVNDSFLGLLGWTRDEVIGRRVDELDLWVDPSERSRMHELFQTEGFVRDYEMKARTKHGEIRYALTSYEQIELGGETCVITSAFDITERKRLDELRVREEQFRLLFQHSPEAILLIDPHDPSGDWPIVDCNDLACVMNGYTRDELIGMPINRLNAEPDDPERRTAYLEWLRKVGVHQDEDVHRRKDGSLVPVEFSTSIIQVGGRELILGVDREITERRQMEELRASEKQFRVLFEQLPDALVLIDPHHPSGTWTIVDCNQAACQMHGYTRKELRGRPFDLLQDHVRAPEVWDRALEQLRQTRDLAGETVHCRKDGTTFPTEYTSALITIRNRELVLRIDRDITQRKQSEIALRESEQRFRALFEYSPDGIVLMDPHDPEVPWKIVDANEAACELNGYAREEMIGLSGNLVGAHPEAWLPTDEWLARLRSEVVHGIDIHRRKDGTAVPVEYSAVLVPLGDRELMLGVDRDITERLRAEEAQRERMEYERFQALLLEQVNDAVIATDLDFCIRSWNKAAERIYGWRSDEVIGRKVSDVIRTVRFMDDDEQGATTQLRSHGYWKGETVHRHRDGREIVIEGSVQIVRDAQGTPVSVVSVNRDVTMRKQAEDALRAKEEYLRALVENGADVIAILAADGTLRYLSPSHERVFGQPPRDRIGRNILDLIDADDHLLARSLMRRLLEQSASTITSELRVRHADGSHRILDVTATNMVAHPAVQGIVVNAHDITERKGMEEQLLHDAFHDALTGLPNRALFLDRIGKALERSGRDTLRQCAVLFLDLDRFKTINDSMGHAVGDQLLVEVSRRLEQYVRPGDTVARFGGDEFAILLEDLHEPNYATRTAERLSTALEAPFMVAGQEIMTSTSIGIALSGVQAGTRPDELLRDADIAMYQAKRLGRGRHAVADPTLHVTIMERMRLEADLRRALDREEFVLYYQPKVAIDGQTILGLEALVRWQHPERGFVSPADFIPVAEDTGLIVPLGAWVLRTACAQLKAWHDEGLPQIFVAVNISAVQFRRTDIAQSIRAIVEDVGLDPHFLALELTESILMEDVNATTAALHELRSINISHIAVDDFGTGYSSLSYLQRFPISVVKIDRSFVSDVTTNPGSAAIAAAIIALAHSLKLRTVAEGVETEAQRRWLEQHACDYFQGYYFSKPLPVEAAARLLAATVVEA